MIGISAFQAWSQSNITAYMPRYLASLQLTPSIYGIIIGLFTAGSAIGCLVGGELADRTSRKTVIAGSLLYCNNSIAPYRGYRVYSPGFIPLMFIAGSFTGGGIQCDCCAGAKSDPRRNGIGFRT